MDIAQSSPTLEMMDPPMVESSLHDDQAAPDAFADKISAYYSLAFPNFTYYLQTLTVTIGRRSVRPGSASTSDLAQVDVDLGPLKSVSRLHARIEYEESQERFVLVVLGRNGAWVDGIWSGSGSRVPLGARSQIQIATRVFHFILPPPPAPEDSPTPSSPSSSTRHLSPSIDITSLSPASSLHTPPTSNVELPPAPEAQESPPPQPIEKGKPPPKANVKKRKKPGTDARPPPPEVMPPRPEIKYTLLCYRAIKSLGGKATLQEITKWISDNFEWYRYNTDSNWESSIRHNLSAHEEFKKLERCAGERGKGFFWSVDSRFEHGLQEQDRKCEESSAAKESMRGKGKNPKLLEPALKRSVKGDMKSPLPPPLLTSTPLPAFANAPPGSSGGAPSASGQLTQQTPVKTSTHVSPVKDEQEAATPTLASLMAGVKQTKAEYMESTSTHRQDVTNATHILQPNSSTDSHLPSIPPDMIVPIVIGPTSSFPSTESSDAPPKASSTFDLSSPPIALQRDTLILNPAIFSSLTPEQLKGLEALGAKKAIEILQSYIVRFIKERIRTEGAKGKGKAKQKKNKGLKKKDGKDGTASGIEGRNGSEVGGSSTAAKSKVKAEPSSTPFTTTPLPSRKPTQVATKGISGLTSTGPTVLSGSSSMLRVGQSVSRASSPPMAALEAPCNEEIDIMGDFEEPIAKRRKLHAGEVLG